MYSAPGVMEHVGQPATLSDCPTHLSSHHDDEDEECGGDDVVDDDDHSLILWPFLRNLREGLILLSSQENQRIILAFPPQTILQQMKLLNVISRQ